MYYPWQQTQWRQLWRAKKEQRLPHALLFSGIAGTGKAEFAAHFARALLCQAVDENGMYCNICHMCRLTESGAHADFLWVQPEKESSAIKIDQIREVSEFIHQTGLQSHYRIVVIHPANQMNANAANALLKTLEEPPASALLILISHQLSQLPPTVVSRCQHILFPQPNQKDALQWLEKQDGLQSVNKELVLNLANGAPLAAKRLVSEGLLGIRETLFQLLYSLSQKESDPIQSAISLHTEDTLMLMDFMLSWVMDLMRLQVGAESIINHDYHAQLSDLSKRTELQRNVKLMENLIALRKQISEGFNLNKQLTWEAVFIRWAECATCF
jgi:DNA polymerase-3 subunit delta'